MIKKVFLYSLLLISPFVTMIGVNELNRPQKPNKIIVFGKSLFAYNTDDSILNKCTWHCHSIGCFHKHVICKYSTIVSSFYENILKLNGIDTIKNEKKSAKGDVYKTLSIITLVVIWPLLMFILLVTNIELFLKRRNYLK
ncbi:MAG: hypothetical protein FJZ67_08800 [Bacteroidetes bacterium]|nr:hypothetical protein [Bacteroidota bacterium]